MNNSSNLSIYIRITLWSKHCEYKQCTIAHLCYIESCYQKLQSLFFFYLHFLLTLKA